MSRCNSQFTVKDFLTQHAQRVKEKGQERRRRSLTVLSSQRLLLEEVKWRFSSAATSA